MLHCFDTTSSKREQGGFTLIEVLIAVVVLSIGLLGLAGLQVTALRNNQSAYMRTQATILAYDIADRMRANVGATAAGDYDYDPVASPTPSAFSDCSTTTGCTEQEMAENDLNSWLASIADFLPAGTGSVCLDSTPATTACDGSGNQFVIRVSWTEQDGTTPEFVTSFQP